MIWEWIRFGFSALFIVSGLGILLVAAIGVYKLDYVLNRMHAAAMGDTLGILLLLTGLIIFKGVSFDSLKLFSIIAFLWLASPVSSHLIARFEITTNSAAAEHFRRRGGGDSGTEGGNGAV
ncbi:MAG: sodium:proton antiporter [Clostridiales bacterium]|nr:MAG: sodium:proton antiporter [Clostridiales bacterium]